MADADTGDGEIDELVAEVAAVDEELAAEVGDLQDRVGDLEEEVDDLESRLKRARADFQNYKKRAEKRREQVRERATKDLIERLLDVRDNLVRAVEHDDDAGVREGVKATLAAFDDVLDAEGVEPIEPDPGDAVDPERHEVVHRVEGGEQEPGTIEEVFRPGYALADTVLRPAQVTVSDTVGQTE